MLGTPQLNPTKAGAMGSGAALAIRQMLHPASKNICSWNKRLGSGAVPAPRPAVFGGVYEPWEEAFVKVWNWRRWLTAKPAVLCNVMCGAGSQGSLCLSVSEVPARGCVQAIREQEEEPLLAKELGGGNPAGKTALNGVFKDVHTRQWAVAHGCQSVGLLSPITITLLQKTHGWLFVSAMKGLSVSTVSSQPMGEGGGRLAQHE